MKNKILVTGSAGFIGFHLCKKLIRENYSVVGVDNLNNYYSPKLKLKRNKQLKNSKNFKFYKCDINNKKKIYNIFKREKFSYVVNLAAQAGVRYSIKNPQAYIDTNILGFFNILELCKSFKIKHFIFASSSSVYGLNKKQPFSEKHTTDHPVSLYGATKKANEIIAHSYSYTYNLPITGLRFFTVYGPAGRPDMSLYLFVDAISKGQNVNLFNYGKMSRSFTYVDKIINGILKIISNPPKKTNEKKNINQNLGTSSSPYDLYNLGSPNETKLKKYLNLIEKKLSKKAKIKYLKMQIGDVKSTRADITKFKKKFGFSFDYDLNKGIQKFVDWYKNFKKN